MISNACNVFFIIREQILLKEKRDIHIQLNAVHDAERIFFSVMSLY